MSHHTMVNPSLPHVTFGDTVPYYLSGAYVDLVFRVPVEG